MSNGALAAKRKPQFVEMGLNLEQLRRLLKAVLMFRMGYEDIGTSMMRGLVRKNKISKFTLNL